MNDSTASRLINYASMHVDAREDKLPVWVRDKLRELRRIAADAVRRAEECRLATKPEESDTFIDRFEGGDIGLGRGTTIIFRVGGGWSDHFRVRVDDERHRLVVMGGDQIMVRPTSGNTIDVMVMR